MVLLTKMSQSAVVPEQLCPQQLFELSETVILLYLSCESVNCLCVCVCV